jgi:hypothetical protein
MVFYMGENWDWPQGLAAAVVSFWSWRLTLNWAIGWPGWDYHQGFYNCALMASNTDADRILIGGLNLWRSDDAGATFQSVAGYIGGPLNMHVDMQDFRAFPSGYWISTDGGMYMGTDGFFDGQPEFRMYGVHGADYWGFGSGWNEDVLTGGMYHNGNNAYHENYGQGNHLELGGGEAPTGYVNPGKNRRTYYSDIGGRIIPQELTGQIGYFSYGMHPNESYWAAESSEMEFHPNCYNIAFIGRDNALWRTDDGGTTFSMMHTFGSNTEHQVKYIEIASDDPQVMYLNQQPVGSNTGTLWKTTDGGQNWTSVPVPSGNFTLTAVRFGSHIDNTGSSSSTFNAYKRTAAGTKTSVLTGNATLASGASLVDASASLIASPTFTAGDRIGVDLVGAGTGAQGLFAQFLFTRSAV